MATESRWVAQSAFLDTRAHEPDRTRLRVVATLAEMEGGEFLPMTDLLDGVECGYFAEKNFRDAVRWLEERGVGAREASEMVSIAMAEPGRTARLIDGGILR